MAEQPQYDMDHPIPLAELAQRVSSERDASIEVYSEVTIGFIGWDQDEREDVGITISSMGDRLDLDFDAEGSAHGLLRFDTEAEVLSWLRSFMSQWLPGFSPADS